MKSRVFKATNVVLGLLCLMYFLTYVDRVNVSTAAGVFRKELNLTNTQVGLVFSAFAYPYLLFQVIGGWVADHFGPRKALTICGVVWAGATIMFGMVHGLAAMIAVRVLLGFGEGATFPTATRAMSYWIPKSKRGFAQGLTHAFSRFGNSITPWLVATIIVAMNWRASFIIFGVISMFWAVAWGIYYRDEPAKHKGITPEELAELPPYGVKKSQGKVPWGRLIKHMAPVTVVYFCYGWILWMFLGWIPQFFANQFHLNLKSSALFASGVFVSGVFGDTLGGIVSDKLFEKTHNLKIARRNLVSISMALCCLSMVPLLFSRDINVIALSLSAGFFCAEFTIGPMWAIPMDIAPKFAGTASGLMNSGSALAAIVSPLIFGIVVDKTGNWIFPFIFSMGVIAMGSILCFTMHPERPLVIDEVETPKLAYQK